MQASMCGKVTFFEGSGVYDFILISFCPGFYDTSLKSKKTKLKNLK